MKLTKNTYTKAKPGVTLIELTVVILVLLTLIGVLFIGANIYKKGADRAACILNIRNIHQAVRANQNMLDIDVGTAINYAQDIYTAAGANAADENFLTEPDCPFDQGAYVDGPGAGNYPVVGDVAVICSTNGMNTGTGDHFPQDTAGW